MAAASHLHHLLTPQVAKLVIDNAIEDLRKIEFDVIVCTGLSGMMVAAPVSYILNKPLCVVRKETESRYSNNQSETTHGGVGVMIDDFIFTGKTVQRVMLNVPMEVNIKYLYLYHDHKEEAQQQRTLAKYGITNLHIINGVRS